MERVHLICLGRIRNKLDILLLQYNQFCQSIVRDKRLLKESKTRVENVLQAQKIIQETAEYVQTECHKQIGKVVTRCLGEVFGKEAPEFKINFQQKRGKTEAELVFIKNGNEINPVREESGGMVDVAAFALRVSCLVMSLPKKRRLLILDEPFKNINGEQYQERVENMLVSLSKEMNIQIVMVSDDSWLKIGKVIEL